MKKTPTDAKEVRIAKEAANAFAYARQRAVAANLDVVVVKDGHLIRVSPSGARVVVGEVKWPPKKLKFHYKKDAEIDIRWAKSQD